MQYPGQPGTPFENETWVSPMDPDVEARVRKETQVPDSVVLVGLTRGIKNIMHSRKLILIAKGAHKAEIISRAGYHGYPRIGGSVASQLRNTGGCCGVHVVVGLRVAKIWKCKFKFNFE
jgi:hypothetical protein